MNKIKRSYREIQNTNNTRTFETLQVFINSLQNISKKVCLFVFLYGYINKTNPINI